MASHHLNYLLQRRRERSLGILLLFAAMVFFSFAGVLLAIYFVPHPSLLFGRPILGSPSEKVIVATLEGTKFTLPETLVASIDEPMLGHAKRIDLRLPWPFDRQQLNIVHASAFYLSPKALWPACGSHVKGSLNGKILMRRHRFS